MAKGKELAADGAYLPTNISRDGWVETEVEVEWRSYLDCLDTEYTTFETA